MRSAASLLLLPLIAACASSPGPQTRAPVPATRPAAVPPAQTPPPAQAPGFRAPRVMNLAGLETVIGRNAAALTAQFGKPRLEVREGDMTKLQFSGAACVLDIYLYPLRQGAEPSATYVDARRASDGLDVDPVACARALRR